MMFCRNCGKEIPGEGDLCDQCRYKDTIFPGIPDDPAHAPPYQPYGQYQQQYGQPPQYGQNQQQYGQPQYGQNQQQNPYYRQNDGNVPMQGAGNGDKSVGFKPALAATIMGIIGAVFALVAYVLSLVVLSAQVGETLDTIYGDVSYVTYTTVSGGSIAGFVITLLLGLGLAIPALVLGIKSIKLFNAGRRAGGVKPVATLVLGIIGVVSASIALSFGALGLLLAMMW